jgi:hypothetical protein
MKEEAEGEAEENWCLRRRNRECSLAGLYAFRVISMSPSESEDRAPGIAHHSTDAWLTSMGRLAEKVMHVARANGENHGSRSPRISKPVCMRRSPWWRYRTVGDSVKEASGTVSTTRVRSGFKLSFGVCRQSSCSRCRKAHVRPDTSDAVELQ